MQRDISPTAEGEGGKIRHERVTRRLLHVQASQKPLGTLRQAV